MHTSRPKIAPGAGMELLCNPRFASILSDLCIAPPPSPPLLSPSPSEIFLNWQLFEKKVQRTGWISRGRSTASLEYPPCLFLVACRISTAAWPREGGGGEREGVVEYRPAIVLVCCSPCCGIGQPRPPNHTKCWIEVPGEAEWGAGVEMGIYRVEYIYY